MIPGRDLNDRCDEAHKANERNGKVYHRRRGGRRWHPFPQTNFRIQVCFENLDPARR
ncbi:hypothetical protein V7x_04640 [Crateriforma conspicua]|uniref:Uncharacterized protein n=1 Tax=Crateriforma conspicua TaxID=2527996 RepID=A0A5C6FTW6_9PLAN|nr:hypothetical protein V7x_04640 [Crateriforma conspicua]